MRLGCRVGIGFLVLCVVGVLAVNHHIGVAPLVETHRETAPGGSGVSLVVGYIEEDSGALGSTGIVFRLEGPDGRQLHVGRVRHLTGVREVRWNDAKWVTVVIPARSRHREIPETGKFTIAGREILVTFEFAKRRF